jgi:hypothetical protein
MKKLRIWASITLTLAILAFILLIFMILALLDIAHGEQNVVTEWAIVRLGLFVLFFLVVASAVCTGLVLKYFRSRDQGAGPKPLD